MRSKISGGGRCAAASLISAIVYLFLCTAALAAGEPPLVIKSGQTQQLPTGDTLQLRNVTGSTQCIHADTSGNLTGNAADCGTVTTTGAPASGNITKFSGATSVTNGDISGDCTTSGTLAITCLKTNGTNFGTFATQNAATPPAIGGTTPAAGSFSSLKDTGIASGTQCVHADSSGNLTGTGSDCGTGAGSVTTTGSPATGNLAKFSGTTSITNGDLSGDCTTSGTLAVTCLKTNGTNFGDLATQNAATPPAIGGTTPAAGHFTTLQSSSISGSTQCVHVDTSGNLTGTGSDCGTGGGGAPLAVATWRLDSAARTASSANNFAAHGNVFTPDHAITVYAAAFAGTTITSATYEVCGALWDTVNHKITTTPVCSPTWTVTTGHNNEDIAGTFSSPLSVSQGQAFTTYFVRTDATGSTSATTDNTTGNPVIQPGFFTQSTTNNVTDLASTNPTTSDTWTVNSAIWHVFNVIYGVN